MSKKKSGKLVESRKVKNLGQEKVYKTTLFCLVNSNRREGAVSKKHFTETMDILLDNIQDFMILKAGGDYDLCNVFYTKPTCDYVIEEGEKKGSVHCHFILRCVMKKGYIHIDKDKFNKELDHFIGGHFFRANSVPESCALENYIRK